MVRRTNRRRALTRPSAASRAAFASPAPGHELWRRDYTGAASIFGVVMTGGSETAAHALMSALALFGLGYSWGGFESLITHETGQLAFRGARPKLAGELPLEVSPHTVEHLKLVLLFPDAFT